VAYDTVYIWMYAEPIHKVCGLSYQPSNLELISDEILTTLIDMLDAQNGRHLVSCWALTAIRSVSLRGLCPTKRGLWLVADAKVQLCGGADGYSEYQGQPTKGFMPYQEGGCGAVLQTPRCRRRRR
jgi:hypothetical protein